ncbi:MAG TPA: VOC family protein [archaeon]|nr:VOC family protein [archaeon]
MRFNKLIPELSVSDFEKSLGFYTKTLGFHVEYTRENFAFLSLQGTQLMIEKTNSIWKTGKLEHPFGRGINFQIEVKDTSPILRSLRKNKRVLFRKPKDSWRRKADMMLGSREFLVQDPDGYLLRFSQKLGTKTIK